ncbi:MAG: hypothetical protein DBY30_05645 [Verrucomicrobia bacterium]|nr:MAG: hypothetical protein DBY30_05645 [Verrucomicrobiota bacterium]
MQSTPRREISGGFSANRKFLPTLKKFRKYAPRGGETAKAHRAERKNLYHGAKCPICAVPPENFRTLHCFRKNAQAVCNTPNNAKLGAPS